MSMVINHNIGAQLTLGELNKNINKAGKLLAKLSSGMKIVGADDDASGYAISEKMREMVRSLDQDDQNVQNGQSLFRTVAGGIDNIVDELRNLKELAINAANDTNTDSDRLTIQKEFDQRIANINDIATETNYNTLKLLDGKYQQKITDMNNIVIQFDISKKQEIFINKDKTRYNYPEVISISSPLSMFTSNSWKSLDSLE